MTQALAPRSNWMQPTTFEEADKLSKYLASKGISVIPKAYANDPGAVLVSIAIGEGYGLSPVQSLQQLHVIHGKVGMDATLIRSRAMAHEDCEYFRVCDVSTTSASVKVSRKSWTRGPQADVVKETVTVTIEDAKRAKWGMRGGSWDDSSSWKKTPDDMLVARATSKAARRYFPELFSGVYETSEIRDIVDVEATVMPDQPDEQPSVGKLTKEDVKPVSSEEVPSEPVALGEALAEGLKEPAKVGEALAGMAALNVPHETSDDAADPPAPLIQNPALDQLEQELESLPTTKELRDRLTEILPGVDWGSEKPHRLIPAALRLMAEGLPDPARSFGEGEPVESQEPEEASGVNADLASGQVEDTIDNQTDPPAPVLPDDDPPPGVDVEESIKLRDQLMGYVAESTSTSDLDNVTRDMNAAKDELFEPHLVAVRRAWSAKREELK